MARTTKIIESQYLNDVVVNGVTTQGLLTLVNTFLAALVNPSIISWTLNPRFVEKRQNVQWMFAIEYNTGGPTLATPFTLRVDMNTSAPNLTTAVNSFLALYAGFSTEGVLTKLDSDVQGYAKQYVEARLLNATATAVVNVAVMAVTGTLSSGLVAAVQNASRFAVGAQGGTGQATEANAAIALPLAGGLRNLRVFPSAAIGGGATVTVKVRINGVDTALSVTFVNADGTTPKVDADYVAVAANDLVDFVVSCDNAGAPAADIQASVEYIHA